MSSYDLPLEAFRLSRGLSRDSGSDAAEAEALEALQPQVHKLRQHFLGHSNTGSVDLDYSGPLADAYLLAYVPGYIQQSLMAYEGAGLDSASVTTVGFFCCGPCPEAVGLVKHLGQQLHPGNLRFHFFDVNHEGWRITREALLEVGCTRRWPGQLELETPHFLDLSEPQSVNEHESVIGTLDLAVFQNFDNEMGEAQNVMRSNIERTAALLPASSALILSDLIHAADRSEANHQVLKEKLAPFGEVHAWKSPGSKGVRVPWPTGPIRSHLLVGDPAEIGFGRPRLVPRTGHDASFLVIKKPADAQGVRDQVASPQRPSPAPARLVRLRPVRPKDGSPRRSNYAPGDVLDGEVIKTTTTAVVIRCDDGEEARISTDHLELGHPPAFPIESYIGRRLSAEVTAHTPLRASRRSYLAKRIQELKEEIRRDPDVTAFVLDRRPDGSLLVSVNGLPGVVPAEELSWRDGRDEVERFGPNEAVPLRLIDSVGNVLKLSRRLRLPDPMTRFLQEFAIGDRVCGTVLSVRHDFVAVDVANVRGSIHVSELRSYWVDDPSGEVIPGEELWMTHIDRPEVSGRVIPAFSLIQDHDRVAPFFEAEWKAWNLGDQEE